MLALNDAAYSAEQYSAYLEQHLDERRQRVEQLDTFVRHRLRLYRQVQEQVQKQKTNKTIETVTLRPPSAPGDAVVVLSQRSTSIKQDSPLTFQQTESKNRVRESKQRLASKQLVQPEQSSTCDTTPTVGTWLHPAPKPTMDQSEHASTTSSGSAMRRSMSESRLSSFALKALTDSVSSDLTHIENRKRLQATRHLFMTIERRQIKEATLLNKKNKEMKRLIELKEAERLHQEETLAQRQVSVVADIDETPVDVNSADPQQLAYRRQQRTREQKRRELERYIRALKMNLKERCSKRGVSVPSLCSCHATVWDADPSTCSQNCSFYQNPTAFATSLHSLLSSCQATH